MNCEWISLNVAGYGLKCLSANDGSVVWNSTITAPGLSPSGYGSPAVIGGRVYIGSETPGSGVYCLDASTGSILWNTPIPGYQWSTPSISASGSTPERLYIGSSNNVLYCLNAMTGAILWNYTTGGRITASPAIVNGRVYIGSEVPSAGKIYCLPMILTTTQPPSNPIPGYSIPFVIVAVGIAIAGIKIRARRKLTDC
ncbi:MAG: PQQ-binding-like beta-propeller repeat protein [Candidatus Sigynarchaeota archaeon]